MQFVQGRSWRKQSDRIALLSRISQLNFFRSKSLCSSGSSKGIQMKNRIHRQVIRSRHGGLALSIVTLGVMMALVQIGSTSALPVGSFEVVKLIGSKGTGATRMDRRMINAWGSAFIPDETPFWINDEATGVSELINGKGMILKSLPFVTIPAADGSTGKPTGIVGNATGEFPLPAGGPSLFIFSTEDGTIAGWNTGTTATTTVNNLGKAAYTGLALANNGTANLLFAANHTQPGSIDVFDSNFSPISTTGGFSNPNLPAGFTPYNVATIDDKLFVTYSDGMQPVGQVDEFDTDGTLIMSFTDPSLNEPWGLTLAPSHFGSFSNDLLVGNLGDGSISVFNPATGEFLGQIADRNSKRILIPGLWSLLDGTGATDATADAVYFTAGPDGYAQGLFGMIQAGPSPKPTPTPKPTKSPDPRKTPMPMPIY
jgi:uncharacterized protein (TIGR03118 family)